MSADSAGHSRGVPPPDGLGDSEQPAPKSAEILTVQAEALQPNCSWHEDRGALSSTSIPMMNATAEAELCRLNIHMMFAFQLLNSVAWSTAMGPVFDKYLLYLGEGAARGPQLVPPKARNSLVGMAESISGISSLVLAVPVGLLVDRRPERRSKLLRLSSGFGLCSAVTLVAAVLTDYALLIYLSLALLGAFSELASSASEAIFADSIPAGQRSGLFTTKAILGTAGVACGPAMSALMLQVNGNVWEAYHMKVVILAGSFLMPAACAALFFFQDPPAARRQGLHRGQHGEASSRPPSFTGPPSTATCGPFRPSHVPYLLACSDFITAIGAGMTVKFFNLFFIEDEHFKPTDICLLQTAYPMVIACFMKCTQSLSKSFGRSRASLLFFSLNVLCLCMLAGVESLVVLIIVYLVRGGFANSSYPLDRSILMDFTPSRQRGRWNAVQSLTSMTWSGSAFIGGVLSDQNDYRYTFLITAAVYAVACLVYSPLLWLVPRSESAHTENGHAGEHTARGTPLLVARGQATAAGPAPSAQ